MLPPLYHETDSVVEGKKVVMSCIKVTFVVQVKVEGIEILLKESLFMCETVPDPVTYPQHGWQCQCFL
jgi:hypothetical protein